MQHYASSSSSSPADDDDDDNSSSSTKKKQQQEEQDKLWREEIDLVKRLIENEDPFNNSAWAHRAFVLQQWFRMLSEGEEAVRLR